MLHNLPFLEKNRKTFEYIGDGKKKIETRAGSQQYFAIKAGDAIEFSCGNEMIIKKVKKVLRYKTLDKMFKVYKPQEINPEASSYEELKKRYDSFPGYQDRLNQYGILVFELE